MKRLLIIGGGFAGMWAALSAARETHLNNGQLEISLISNSPYIVMRPRLYEANPATMRTPLFQVMESVGVRTIEGEVGRIDPNSRQVTVRLNTDAEKTIAYDRLILAAGSRIALDRIPGAIDHAHNVDSYEAACDLEAHIKTQLAQLDRPGALSFVIIGAGFTGIELATALRPRLSHLADSATADAARIMLIETDSQLGPTLGEGPRPAIRRALDATRVEVRLGTSVSAISPESVSLNTGEPIPARTTVVTVGPRANSLTEQVSTQRDKAERLAVDRCLRVKGADSIYAAGDVAQGLTDAEHVSVMSCQHAIPQGKYAGYNAARELMSLPTKPYEQIYYQTCLDLGVNNAVLTTGWDRDVKVEGADAKALKQQINQVWIYPPQGTKEEIFNTARLDYRVGRG